MIIIALKTLGHFFAYWGSWFLLFAAFGATEYFMPAWVQILIAVAALLVAIGIIWKKLIQPAAKLIALMDDCIPLLKDLVEHLKDTPNVFQVLNEIVAQFRTDSGSSLRDAINRLEAAANENKKSAEVLKINADVAKELSEQDRRQLARIILLVDEIYAKTDLTSQGLKKMEIGGGIIAKELAEAQKRADQSDSDDPGAAADAAARSPKKK